ncbi:unnamed protein product, partial [Rotaria sp. Silwood1]
LGLVQEQEERKLRNKMKVDLTLIENNIRENHLHENKSLENCQPNELNNIDETIEREKQELQKKLNYLNLEQQNNTNIQIRLLQMKHEFDEKLRNVKNRYKNEIEDLTRYYEQITVKNDTLEKHSTQGSTSYDMGYVFGQLMSEGLKQLLVAKWIAEYGLPDALDLNYDITRKYTPTWYDEELRGLAAELIKAACSVLGTWDESTISSTLLHLRSLNWDEKAPIDKYSTITIYHLNASYEDYANHFHDYYKQKYTTSHTFANFDYADLVGAIRAYIQFSNSLNIALAMLINTKRTCSVHLNLEEFHRNTSNNNIGFLGIEYRAKEFNVYL